MVAVGSAGAASGSVAAGGVLAGLRDGSVAVVGTGIVGSTPPGVVVKSPAGAMAAGAGALAVTVTEGCACSGAAGRRAATVVSRIKPSSVQPNR